ncbi:MAG TPA: hypothetical protein VFI70_07095 [Nitrososphaeraceae archaeon]|nr:hypothetical protein [Nitrososphaeraceae archaeon]
MLLDEAQGLYDKLAKDLVDEIITDCASTTSSSLLPLLPPSEEKVIQQQLQLIRPICIQKNTDLLNQKYMMTIKMEANILLWIKGNPTVPLSLHIIIQFCNNFRCYVVLR